MVATLFLEGVLHDCQANGIQARAAQDKDRRAADRVSGVEGTAEGTESPARRGKASQQEAMSHSCAPVPAALDRLKEAQGAKPAVEELISFLRQCNWGINSCRTSRKLPKRQLTAIE